MKLNLKKNKFKIIDDIYSNEQQDLILNQLTNDNFPWYLSKENVTAEIKNNKLINKNVVDIGQFGHTFYNYENKIVSENSQWCSFILNMLQVFVDKFSIEKFETFRIKANLLVSDKKYKKDTYGIPHIDMDENHYVFIYYVNDSDGDTFLFENNKLLKRISPKKGRVLLFNGDLYHAAGHPVKSNKRIVLNCNVKF
jgi:hypothetical protein